MSNTLWLGTIVALGLKMNYLESVEYIEGLTPVKGKPSLDKIELFLKELDNPQNSFPVIHVGGTNGKGSTAILLDTLLRALGLKTGRFTGPHILSWKERISIEGEFVSSTEFARLATEVRKLSESFAQKHEELGTLSWFEFLTAMAFLKFQSETVDLAVLEVGLGGRFDATNAANNVSSTVITNIDLDHTHILGDTVQEIAFEKAGIMKANVPVITQATGDALLELERQAKLKGTTLVNVNKESDQLERGFAKTNCKILQSRKFILEKLALLGPHQKNNSNLAIYALSQIKAIKNLITEDTVKNMQRSLENVFWPGRMQIVKERNLIMDVAHNPASARVLRSALDQLDKEKSRTFLVGFFMSKDVPGFLKNLLKEGDNVIACDLNTRRKFFEASYVKEICRSMGVDCKVARSVSEGLDFFYEKKFPKKQLVATGSFQTIRATMDYLGYQDAYQQSNNQPYKSKIEAQTSPFEAV